MISPNPNTFQPTPNFRARRQPKLARLQLTTAANQQLDIIVSNISATGLNAIAHGPAPTANEVVQITLPDSRVLWGLVRWTDGHKFGVEFDTTSPMDSAPTPILQQITSQ